MTDFNATEKILNAVNYTISRSNQAESDFDDTNSKIQRMASQNIDLFGGTATSQVADIISEARRACDTLYATYQALIVSLDETCRPLLEQNPSYDSVRRVKNLIKWLNDESEIENNFTASLNGSSKGDVGSVRYYPSINNKIIQNYWEDKCNTHPEKTEHEERERRALEERTRIHNEEIEKKRLEKEAEYEKAMKIYEEAHREWIVKHDEIEAKRKKLITDAVDSESTKLRNNAERSYIEKKDQLQLEKENAEKALEEAKIALENASFFSFSAKKDAKALIASSEKMILDCEAASERLYADYLKTIDSIPNKVAEIKRTITAEINKKHPIPAKPKKPVKKVTSATSSDRSGSSSAEVTIAEKLLDEMEFDRLYTIADIMESCPSASNLTLVKVSSIIRGMLGVSVERIEDTRKAYFKRIM